MRIADTKMIAVFSKRGCSRIIAASSNPSRSGMQTSISRTAMSFLSRCSSASLAEFALMRFSPSSSSVTSWLSSFAGWSSTSRILTLS